MAIFTRSTPNSWEPGITAPNEWEPGITAPNETSHQIKIPNLSKTSNDNKWERPLGYVERFMVGAHDYGNMTTLYALWIDSRKPLNLSFVKQAASILYRKIPNLRMSIRKHKKELWWKEMENENVDIEQIVTENFTDTFECLLKKNYNIKTGPLWFIRLIVIKANQAEDASIDEKQVCVFGFLHSATDGTTNMKICKVFLDILNNLILGNAIDMSEEGIFAPPLHDRLADEHTSCLDLSSLCIQRFWSGFLSCGSKVSNFTNLYPQPSHEDATTIVLYDELDELTTSQLIQRCKIEKVTLNSAFTAAANLGVIDLIKAKDQSIEETKIKSTHIVNMRRFWPKEFQSSSFGCHISAMDISCNTNCKQSNNFWEYAREVHSVIKTSLNDDNYCLKVLPISEKLNPILYSNVWLSRLGLPAHNDNHFSLSNMGNLSETFPGTGPEVRVSKFIRCVSNHFMPSLCIHNIQTFQGKLTYCFDYYTQKMKKETAEIYSKNIFNILRGVID